jgi:hypothetical protein
VFELFIDDVETSSLPGRAEFVVRTQHSKPNPSVATPQIERARRYARTQDMDLNVSAVKVVDGS